MDQPSPKNDKSPQSGPQVRETADCGLERTPSGPVLVLRGRLDSHGAAAIWDKTLGLADTAGPGELKADLSGVGYLDGAGAGLLLEIGLKRKSRLEITGLAPEFAPLVNMFNVEEFARQDQVEAEKSSLPEEVGKNAVLLWLDFKDLVAFVGECSLTLYQALRKPKTIRWKDCLNVCETAGVNGLPIVTLIGFLMGLIMSFQSAVPLKRFGADLYVADLLGISMTRELGPLVTAILLAGRSGSAFAAEIGTMKVNEEVNALITMGLDPVRFLAAPRIIAAMIVTPVLTVFFNLFAMAGGALVVTGFGYSLTTYMVRVDASLKTGDILGGLFKALLFSLLVAGIGCQRGLKTGTGASAVGASTTSSVVSGLVLIAVADGVMAVIFYFLGI